MKAKATLPPARNGQLVIRELPEETLVYDLERHEAHCLNNTSAFVWKHCDGQTTVEEMTRLLSREFDSPVDDDVVWLALKQLRRLHLLEEGSGRIGMMKVTRRDLVRKYLPAALALPVILSIPAPTAAQALSTCAGDHQPCDDTHPCCPGFNCDGICFPD
ncbi:MAG TPA: PqqD family protein [Pyrinomonadaceae bacterium]